MLPYMVFAGHTKYVAYIPHYLHVMRHVPPDVVTASNQGHFTFHVMGGKINGVWTDMAVAQKYNKEAKMKLFKGTTQQQAAR